MRERIAADNLPVMALDDAHPAKRFLCAFSDCLDECACCEIYYDPPIDQQWTSETDGRAWRFSGFVYCHLCYSLVLDGFITRAPDWTDSERWAFERLPLLHTMMNECAHAALDCGNTDCLELIEEVVTMLKAWEEYLEYRGRMIAGEIDS